MNIQHTTQQIKRIAWEHFVTRNEALLLATITEAAYGRCFEATGLRWNVRSALRVLIGEVWYGAGTTDDLSAIFQKRGLPLLRRFERRLVVKVRELDRTARTIERIDPTQLSQRELVRRLERFFDAALLAHNFLSPMPIAGSVISAAILERLPSASDRQKQRWLGILTYPERGNSHVAETRSFFRLAEARRTDEPTYFRRLREHVRQFGWIGSRNYWWNFAWTEESAGERVAEFLSQGKRPLAELRRFEASRRKNLEASKRLQRRLRIPLRSVLGQYLRLARSFAYLRTWRTDVIYRAGFRVRRLFLEAARRARFPVNDVQYVTMPELLAMAQRGRTTVRADEVNRRREYWALWRSGAKLTVLSGTTWKRALSGVFDRREKDVTSIKGTTAYRGIVRGTARIVRSMTDLPNVRRGDILIATMTFPSYVPAMERAAAFVTDEGGILCHAAIVAREMKKPCVIGTKIATKVLKDGDRVEVDATKGAVRKL